MHRGFAKIESAPYHAESPALTMTQQKQLELRGDLAKYPLGELIVEIAQVKLSGSLRLSGGDQKTIIYFDSGRFTYAVSNSKALRFFNILLEQKKIDQPTLALHPTFSNDLELTRSLQVSGTFTEADLKELTTLQIDSVLIDALLWTKGDWAFDPAARLRSDMKYEAHVNRLLIDYARCVPTDQLHERFRSVQEGFSPIPNAPEIAYLQAHESYVLSIFHSDTLTIDKLRAMCSLPEGGLMQSLYTLWLGGVLHRHDWNSAFSASKIGEIQHARLVSVKPAKNLAALPQADPEKPVAAEVPAEEPNAPAALEISITVTEYLKQVEGSKTHYDTLGIANDAEIGHIKQTYFALAKLFHPDKFHRETDAMQRRIQTAFTELSHAYETLKDTEAREAYNFKTKKEMVARDKRKAEGHAEPEKKDVRGETALQAFEQGLQLLNNEEYEQAAMLLGRAVHYSPENAQFHAYFGQALSFLERQEHKAEGEFQAAIKLDPSNAKIRMMLIDFFIDMEMTKRAVGELNRFLKISPGNSDATRRLAKLTVS